MQFFVVFIDLAKCICVLSSIVCVCVLICVLIIMTYDLVE